MNFKYVIKRFITGFVSAICVVVLVIGLVYSSTDKNSVFAGDQVYSKLSGVNKELYKYRTWELYGYCDYVNFYDYRIDNASATRNDFFKEYGNRGYSIENLESTDDGYVFAYKNISVARRLLNFFSGLIWIDTTNYIEHYDADRYLDFTLHDPVYGGKFAPAVIGSGTYHRYLLYFDSVFPFVHQNFININLGRSCSVNVGEDVWQTMNERQGDYVYMETVYPSSYTEVSADNLHSAVYSAGSLSTQFNMQRYDSDYTIVSTNKNGMSRLGYSFIIGSVAVILAYVTGISIGVLMTRYRILDGIGNLYILLCAAIPGLAYVFFIKALGRLIGLPVNFDPGSDSCAMYIMPVLSIALSQMAEHMKWCRRYVTDQKRSVYVQFERNLGFSDKQIFSDHVLKNAIVPMVQGIPAGLFGALGGAIITERVYSIPGVGGVLTTAINSYDNAVIVGVTFFYAVISVFASILGDWLLVKTDPRISLD